MPKTRRNRKVGGKRRKSMKGGSDDIQKALQDVQESIKGVANNAKLDEHKRELEEQVKAMQANSIRLAQSGMSSMQLKGSEAPPTDPPS